MWERSTEYVVACIGNWILPLQANRMVELNADNKFEARAYEGYE